MCNVIRAGAVGTMWCRFGGWDFFYITGDDLSTTGRVVAR